MPTLPLQEAKYEDDQKALIDKFNENFRQLEWMLNFANLGSDNIKAKALTISGDATFVSGYDPTTKETPTGAQTKADAAVAGLKALLGGLAYDSIVEKAKLGTTVISGGYLVTDLIQAGSIVASKLSVSQLSAISANLGTITAGSITALTTCKIGTDLYLGENAADQRTLYINSNKNVLITNYSTLTAPYGSSSDNTMLLMKGKHVIVQAVGQLGLMCDTLSGTVSALVARGNSDTQVGRMFFGDRIRSSISFSSATEVHFDFVYGSGHVFASTPVVVAVVDGSFGSYGYDSSFFNIAVYGVGTSQCSGSIRKIDGVATTGTVGFAMIMVNTIA